jgi:hypothetical protein
VIPDLKRDAEALVKFGKGLVKLGKFAWKQSINVANAISAAVGGPVVGKPKAQGDDKPKDDGPPVA